MDQTGSFSMAGLETKFSRRPGNGAEVHEPFRAWGHLYGTFGFWDPSFSRKCVLKDVRLWELLFETYAN